MINGYKIKQARTGKKMSQTELAEAINTSVATISFFENGNRKPTIENLIKICEVLDLTPNDILGYDVNYIKEDIEEYSIHLSKQEIDLIKELRKHPKLYKQLFTEPKRSIEKLNRNIMNY